MEEEADWILSGDDRAIGQNDVTDFWRRVEQAQQRFDNLL